MGEMFEIMNDMRRLSGELPPEFLLTHPITSSRVSDAFSAADQYPDLENQKSDSLDYSLIRARLMVQAEDGIRDAQESRGLGDVYKRQQPFFSNNL